MSALILIVEDEPDLLHSLEFALEHEGYRVIGAPTGGEAMQRLEQEPLPDLVLLDVMLPDMRGTDICRSIRADARTQNIPVFMLTARGEEIDRVVGFELGADDYIVKPFSLRELKLRIRNALRTMAPASTPTASEVRSFGTLKIDRSGHRAWVEGEPIELTALEFGLLDLFLSRKGRVQSRERLLRDVWNTETEVTARTVDSQVKRLRRKLGSASRYIETVRGVGYRFRADP